MASYLRKKRIVRLRERLASVMDEAAKVEIRKKKADEDEYYQRIESPRYNQLIGLADTLALTIQRLENEND